MLFSVVKFRKNLSELSSRQKKTIVQYIILLNVVMLSIIGFISLKINHMVKDQNAYFDMRVNKYNLSPADQKNLQHKIPVDLKITINNMQDINLKEKTIDAEVIFGLSYNKLDFKTGSPDIELYNGDLKSKKLINSTTKNGRVNDQFIADVEIHPNYQSELYPLDKELVSLVFVPRDYMANYYFLVSDFWDNTDYDDLGQGDYKLIKMGFLNTVGSELAHNESNQTVINYYGYGRSYAIFDHKTLYSYIKSIQYIILSLLIAVFALLINSRVNSPKNGRITVIGSSVFSLVANVFQINSINRTVGAITLIDLITSFAALIIFFAFLVTLRTLIFIDEDGYPTSRIFDQAMFATLMLNMLVFFTGIYFFA